MTFPTTIPRGHGYLQPAATTQWAPYGPNTPQLLYHVYNDFPDVFTAFSAGALDQADWQIPKALLSDYIANPDFFVTQQQGEFGIFQVDINHQSGAPFLTCLMQAGRSATTAGQPATCSNNAVTPPNAPGTPTLTPVSQVAGCAAGSMSLVINLVNIEEGGGIIRDAKNLVTETITGQSTPTATKQDNGGFAAPTGTYTLPCVSTIPSSYGISTTVYSGAVTIATSGATQPVCIGGNVCTFTFAVNYNSPSTMKPTVSSVEISRAVAHLIDKPAAVSGEPSLIGCVDVQDPTSHGLFAAGTPCGYNLASSDLSNVYNLDCSTSPTTKVNYINPNEHTWFSTTCGATGSPKPVSLYNLVSDVVKGAATCAAGTIGVTCFPSQASSPPTIGYSGTADLRAACDHFVAAGFSIVPAGATCLDVALGNVVGGVTAHLNNNGGHVIMYVRTDPDRKYYGTIIADELNFLFGTPAPTGGTVCYGTCPQITPLYFTISQVTPIVFSATTTWNLYTGKFGLGLFPDQLYTLYHSSLAGTTCGGKSFKLPPDYPVFCDPVFDTQSAAGEFPPTGTPVCPTAGSASFCGFQNAALLAAIRGMSVAYGLSVFQDVALKSWDYSNVGSGSTSSLVSVIGNGFVGGVPFTNNLRPVAGFDPCAQGPLPAGYTCSNYFASGCNPSTGCRQNVIRRSMAQTTLHINPYFATTAWEIEPMLEIYDSMLFANPNTGPANLQLIDWAISGSPSHSASFDSGTNTLTQTWHLRHDIFFHNGTPVTASDVCFSILTDRDIPSANFIQFVSSVKTCTATDSKTVVVTLSGNSPFAEIDIGGVPIVPSGIWASHCNWLNTGPNNAFDSSSESLNTLGGDCANPGFDPVATGIMVGSGQWICNFSVGVSTIPGQASCAQNANGSAGGQALGADAKILLDRNLAYMRCCGNEQAPTSNPPGQPAWSQNGIQTSSYEALSWADFNKDGKITLVDAATIAFFFNKQDPYFANPTYALPSTPRGTVDLGDEAVADFYFDHGTTSPFLGTPTGPGTATPPAMAGLDPSTDPFVLNLGGGILVYYLGTTSGAVHLSVLTGAPTTASFSASAVSGGTTIGSGAATTPDAGQIDIPFNTALTVGTSYTLTVTYAGSTAISITVDVHN